MRSHKFRRLPFAATKSRTGEYARAAWAGSLLFLHCGRLQCLESSDPNREVINASDRLLQYTYGMTALVEYHYCKVSRSSHRKQSGARQGLVVDQTVL